MERSFGFVLIATWKTHCKQSVFSQKKRVERLLSNTLNKKIEIMFRSTINSVLYRLATTLFYILASMTK